MAANINAKQSSSIRPYGKMKLYASLIKTLKNIPIDYVVSEKKRCELSVK
jgi:hypothetical protein